MFILEKIYLSGFKGFKHISDDLSFSLDLTEHVDSSTFLLYGENGKGKTTLLENLTPYPFMISRDDIKESLVFPAQKIITFLNQHSKTRIRLETYWLSTTETKGFIFIDNAKEPTIETQKGNITEFNIQIEKIFGEFKKFKYSTFLQQGIYEIVKAKPSERIKIINHFIADLSLYDQIKSASSVKCDLIKTKMMAFEKKQDEYKTFENKYLQIQQFEQTYNEGTHLLNISAKKQLIEQRQELLLKITKVKTINEQKNHLELQIALFESSNHKKELLEQQEQLNLVTSKLQKFEGFENTFSPQISTLTMKAETTKRILNSLKNTNQTSLFNNLSLTEDNLLQSIEQCNLKIHKLHTLISLTRELSIYDTNITQITQKRSSLSDNLSSLKPPKNAIINDKKIIKNLSISETQKITALTAELQQFISNKLEIDALENSIQNSFSSFSINSIEELEQIQNVNNNLLHEINLKKAELSKLQKIKTNILFTDDLTICSCCGQNLNATQISEHIFSVEQFLLSNDEKRQISLVEYTSEAVKKNQISLSQISKLEEANENIDPQTILSHLENNKLHLNFLNTQLELVEASDSYKVEHSKLQELLTEINTQYNHLQSQRKDTLKEVESIKTNESIQDLQAELIFLNTISEEISFLESENLALLNTEELFQSNLEKILNETTQTINSLNDDHSSFISLKNLESLSTTKISNISNLVSNHELNSRNLNNLSEQIANIPINYQEEDILSQQIAELEKIIESTTFSLHEYTANKSWLEKTVELYRTEKKQYDEDAEQLFSYNKIKNYTDRIRRTFVAEFFGNLTSDINNILSNDKGTLGHLKIRIEHKNINKFDILVNDGFEDVSDINLLSGAEQATVARAIYFALAKMTNFGILWLDEFDGMLSQTNKEVFVETLFKIKDFVGVNQIFIISHNPNLIKEVDFSIEIK